MTIMKKAGVLIALIAAAAVAPANAQQADLSRAGMQIYESCKSLSAGLVAGDLKTSCACLAGYYGGLLSDRDLALADILLRVGARLQQGASEDQVVAEVGQEIADGGFSEADVERVASVVEQAGTRIDQVCAGFQQPGASV